MKRVVIFSGGTGSIALQTGIHAIYGESVKVDIIISAYDNGKSTGECRKVFGGKILGPSDLRKNQLTQYRLQYHTDSPSCPKDKALLYELFEERFTQPSWESAYQYVRKRVEKTFEQIANVQEVDRVDDRRKDILLDLVDFFFYSPYAGVQKRTRRTIPTTNFTNFSISNLFYAAAAALNENSLGLAGELMADILQISNNVHVVSDVNLYLYAETQNRNIISDEGEIVSWNHAEDPIVDVSLIDEYGRKYVPSVDENSMATIKVRDIISEADIIIYSSGTQWSSLIPTYMHNGLREILKQSRAKKYLVMNNRPDKDMIGLGASDLLQIIDRYLDLEDTTIVMNKNAHPSMSQLPDTDFHHYIIGELSTLGDERHNPKSLVSFIMQDYYKEYLPAKYYYFDFDDTIWSTSKESIMRRFSKENIRMVFDTFHDRSIIISGNSSHHFIALTEVFSQCQQDSIKDESSIHIYCNGGNCHYLFSKGQFQYKGNLCSTYDMNDDYYILSSAILRELNSNGWNLSMSNFENRGNCILSIKPLQNREQAQQLIAKIIVQIFGKNKYIPYINGNTTIDIMNAEYNKCMCAEMVTKELGLKYCDVTYVGDKIDDGNDACLADIGFRILGVNDVVDFNCFVKTYQLYIE